jgi:pimeloyl-ACP methyl ester carboxylesterase
LEKRGHKIFVPTLTGLGERSHLLSAKVDLSTHIEDVVNVIKWERLENFVLVGHSYGGKVLSGVAEHMEKTITSIFFIDAFVPDTGPQENAQAMLDAIRTAQLKGEVGIKPPPAAGFQNNEKDRAWLDAMFTPQPVAAYTTSLALTGARERIAKKTFVRAMRYREPVFDAAYAKVRSNPAWRTYELDCGHHVMVDMPERLTEILLGAA